MDKRATWWDSIPSEVDVIASSLGVLVNQRGVYCPACREEHRGRNDRRPAAIWCHQKKGWECMRCNAKGNAIQYLCYHLTGKRLESGDREWQNIREYCEKQSWVAISTEMAINEKPQEYLPALEAENFWNGCTQLKDACRERAVRDFINMRGWDNLINSIHTHDLARIVPRQMNCPPWWPSSWRTSWRLVVRAYRSDGTIGGIHARSITPLPEDKPKARWHWSEQSEKNNQPAKWTTSGLLFACPVGLRLMKKQPIQGLIGIIVSEGITDWIRAAAEGMEWARPGQIPAIFGGTSGSWSGLAFVRFPIDVQLLVATDPDKGGEQHAQHIREACAMARSLPPAVGAPQ